MPFQQTQQTRANFTDDDGNGLVMTGDGTTITFVLTAGGSATTWIFDGAKSEAESFASAAVAIAGLLP